MHLSGKLALRVAAVGVSGAAVLIPTAVTTTAHAATVPSITVTPNANLVDGQVVHVSGTDFPPKAEPVAVVTCNALTGESACDTSHPTLGQTDATGSFTNLAVKVYTTASGGMCAAGSSCYVVATTDLSQSGTPDPSQEAYAPVTFAKTTSAATKTAAHYKKHKVVGAVTSNGTGVKGLKALLEMRKHGHWKKVATLKTKASGAFTSKKLHKAGTYEVKTPKQTKGTVVYKASHSKKIKVKA